MAIGRPITETPNIADKIISIIATAGQTEFTVTGGYRVNHLAVFRNGVRLVTGRDYIAGDGLTVELIEDASLNDVLEFQVFDTFSISDAIVGNSTSQTLTGDLTVNGTLTVGASGIGTLVLDTMNVGIISSTTGITTIQSLQASSSTSTGALVVKGGVGIGKSLYVGGNLSVGGTVTYEDVTNIDSIGIVTGGKGLRATTGGLVVTAGITTLAGLTTVTSTAALHSKQLNVSAGSTFGGAATFDSTLTVSDHIYIADKIVHTGDTNTVLRFPSNDTIAAQTAGVERLRIDASGNTNFGTQKSVAFPSGIGIQVYHSTNPRIKLTNDTTGNGATDGTQVYLTNDGDTIIDNKDSEDIIIHTNASEKLRITSAGKVGINSTVPGYTLDMTGDQIRLRSNSSGSNAVLRLWGQDANTGGALIAQNSTGSAAPLYFYYSNSDLGMTLDSSGRLLLGTTTEGAGTYGDLLTLSATHAGITIRSATTGYGSIYFSDGTSGNDEKRGLIDYYHSDNRMTFYTDASERMRITSGGDVGINETSPDQLLHIKDSNPWMEIEGTAASSGDTGIYLNANANHWVIKADNYTSTNQFQIKNGDTSSSTARLAIDSSGRLTVGDEVGSNRTSYRTQLSAADANVLSLQHPSNSDGADINLGFYARNTNNAAVQYAAIVGQAEETQANSTQKGHLRFGVNIAGTVTEKMRITGAGTVNVGTETNQTAYTFAVTNSDWQCMRIENTNADASGAYIDLVKHSASPAADDECGVIRFRGDDSAGTETTYAWIKGITEDPTNSGENGRIIFQTSENGSGSDRVVITSAGNVGINDTAPDQIVSVKNNGDGECIKLEGSDGAKAFAVGSTNTHEGYLRIYNDNTIQCQFASNMTNYITTGNNEQFVVGSSSATGGVSSGRITLEFPANSVAGYKSRDTQSNGNAQHMVIISGSSIVGYIKSSTTNASFHTSSDYRLKENVVDLTDGITRLKQLKPRKFEWKSDSTNTLVDGFIAHEADGIIPDLVSGTKDATFPDGKIDPQTVDYAKLTPLLTAALQEAIGKIEVLEAKVAALEST